MEISRMARRTNPKGKDQILSLSMDDVVRINGGALHGAASYIGAKSIQHSALTPKVMRGSARVRCGYGAGNLDETSNQDQTTALLVRYGT